MEEIPKSHNAITDTDATIYLVGKVVLRMSALLIPIYFLGMAVFGCGGYALAYETDMISLKTIAAILIVTAIVCLIGLLEEGFALAGLI